MFLLFFFSNKKGKSAYVVGLEDSFSCQQVSSRLASTKIFDLQYYLANKYINIWKEALTLEEWCSYTNKVTITRLVAI